MICLRAIISLLIPALATTALPDSHSQTALANDALAEILSRGAPILGFDNGCDKKSKTCDWMARIPDNTKLVHMNIPGTHDTSTWNYTQATQDELDRYVRPDDPAETFQCQEKSIFQSLNDGIRAFDLRFAYNPGNDTIGMHHSGALLAPTTQLEDIFFGMYAWLDKHPTEALVVMMNHEGGTGTPNDVKLYTHLYNILNNEVAHRYWVQTSGTLGTLQEARGKLTLLQRWNYPAELPSQDNKRIGISLPPSQWLDNHPPSIQIVYNKAENQTAFIEDYYEIGTNEGTEGNIIWKYNATSSHIDEATKMNPDQLYITFSSAEHNSATPPVHPKTIALGNGTVLGVNQRLLPFLQERKGKRVGIVLMDFYDAVPGLVEAVIGL